MKRSIISLLVITVLLSTQLGVIFIGKAHADTSNLYATHSQIQHAKWEWQNSQTIIGTINGTAVKFVDAAGMNNYWDSDPKAGGQDQPRSWNYGYTSGPTCDRKQSKLWANPYYPKSGESFFHGYIYAMKKPDNTDRPYCRKVAIPAGSIKISNSNAASVFYTFSDKSIIRVDGDSQYTFNPSGFANVYTIEGAQFCPDTIVYNPRVGNKMGNGTLWPLSDVDNFSHSSPPSWVHAASNCYPDDSGSDVTDNPSTISFLGLGAAPPIAFNKNYSVTIHIGGPPPSNPGMGGSGGSGSGGSGSGGSGTSSPTISCNISFNPLTWLLCPAVDGMMAIVNQLENAINNELSVGAADNSTNPSQIFCGRTTNSTCVDYETAWASMRDIALGLLLIIGLIIIISQALGMEFLDAYTVRKAMPRLVAAAILITLSWPLMQFAVILTNSLGYGVQQLIYSPFHNLVNHITLNGGGEAAVNIIGLGAIAAMGIFAVLSFAATAALAVFVGYLIIVIRQLLIILLVIVAPVAIVCMVLPNTHKAFKLWFDEFRLALLMFPIIATLIAVGRVFAAISLNSARPNLLDQFIGFAAFFAPYFILPFTFRFAGGALSTISGKVQQGHKGAFDRVSKYRAKKASQTWQKTKNYQRLNESNRVFRGVNSVLGGAVNPKDAMHGRKGIRAGRYTGMLNQGADNLKNDATWQAHQNDDNFLVAFNQEMWKEKYEEAEKDFNTASSDEERASAKTKMDALNNGMALSQRVKSRDSAGTRLQALNHLARTGYQFSDGQEGYAQLSRGIRSIVGKDQGAYSAAMNTAQFNLKEAGRYELGGVNNGAGYDPSLGLDKVDPYTLAARAKPSTIREKGNLMTNALTEARAAETRGEADRARELYKQAEIHRIELSNVADNATGANKKAAIEQLDRVDTGSSTKAHRTNGLLMQRWRNEDSGQPLTVRENLVPGASTVGWSRQEEAQGYKLVERSQTNGDIARREASGGRRPNPADM